MTDVARTTARAPAVPMETTQVGTAQGVTNSAALAVGRERGIGGWARSNAGLLASLGVAGVGAGSLAVLARRGHPKVALGLGAALAGGLLLTACGGGGKNEPTPPGRDPNAVSPFSSSEHAILIQLTAKPEEAPILAMARGAERKEAAWNALKETASSSQEPLVAIASKLKREGKVESFEQLTSPNMVIVEVADNHDMAAVARQFDVEGVKAIYDNGTSRQILGDGTTEELPPDELDDVSPTPLNGIGEKNIEGDAVPVNLRTLTTAGWGVDRIGAPSAWERGATGEGLVYGSIDTGVDWDHKALKDHYRGAANRSVDHNYNWMDFDRSSSEPTDADGHGTHTTGNVVGYAKDEDIHLGVARDSKFIAARALGQNTDGLIRALQFMQAPTRLDGTDARPDLAPDVVGMSWRAGSAREALFQDAIHNLELAGIEPVVAAGNSGPRGSTVTAPGSLPESITIGATDSSGEVADFSSRGPNVFPGSSAQKPDFMAPGVNTPSTYPGDSYARLSGTSMAQPHAAGAILSILSKYPDLSHDELLTVLRDGTIDGGAPGPDDIYGNGEINLPQSLDAAERVEAH